MNLLLNVTTVFLREAQSTPMAQRDETVELPAKVSSRPADHLGWVRPGASKRIMNIHPGSPPTRALPTARRL